MLSELHLNAAHSNLKFHYFWIFSLHENSVEFFPAETKVSPRSMQEMFSCWKRENLHHVAAYLLMMQKPILFRLLSGKSKTLSR